MKQDTLRPAKQLRIGDYVWLYKENDKQGPIVRKWISSISVKGKGVTGPDSDLYFSCLNEGESHSRLLREEELGETWWLTREAMVEAVYPEPLEEDS